jgi:hypothetical protein
MVETTVKRQLLDDMRASGREFVETVRQIPSDRWPEGRYEEGWTAKDILAHVASIEWTYPRLLSLAALPPEERDADKRSGSGVGDYNQRQVGKRKDASVEELIEEFERNRAATIGAVAEADESLLDQRVRSAGGTEGPAADVLNFVAVIHVQQHLDDIRAGGT